MPQSLPDLSEFEAKSPVKNRCWYSRLDAEQRAKADAAKAAGYSTGTIARVVTDWGVKITGSPISNHYSEGHTCG